MPRPSERDIAAVMAGAVEDLPDDGRILIANDPTGVIAGELVRRAAGLGTRLQSWRRRSPASGTECRPWPPDGPFAAAIVRLPKARAELDMTVHAVASVTEPSAPIWLYGANDEGIKSAVKPMAAVLGPVTTVDTRGHCRVLRAQRPETIAGLRPRLADWRMTVTLDLGTGDRTFVTYPGLFAAGRLDAGTRLLLDHLPPMAENASVLDFGSGMGVIAAAVAARHPGARLTLVDTDAVALEAARENMPGAALKTDLADIAGNSLDVILSNPPIHDGKSEDHTALKRLVEVAPRLLRRGGVIGIVVQRRVAADRMLREALGGCSTVAEDGVFQVLRANRS